MGTRILKFCGLVLLVVFLQCFGSIGFLLGAAIIFAGLWKLAE